MSDNAASELLIKIKTVLESQGVDAATKEIDALINKTSASTGELARNTKEHEANSTAMSHAAHAAFILRGVAEGQARELRGLTGLVAQLGGAVGAAAAQIGLLVTAFGAGFTIGKTIREWAVAPFKESEEQVKKVADAVAKLDAISLKILSKNAKEVADQFERATQQGERLARLEAAKSDVQLGRELNENQLDFESGAISEPERTRRDRESNRNAEERKLEIEQGSLLRKTSDAEKERDKAKEQLAHSDVLGNSVAREEARLQEMAQRAGLDPNQDPEKAAREELSPTNKALRLSGMRINPANPNEDYDQANERLMNVIDQVKTLAAAKQRAEQNEPVADAARKAIAAKDDEISDLRAQSGLIPQRRVNIGQKYEGEQQEADRLAAVARAEQTAKDQAALDATPKGAAYKLRNALADSVVLDPGHNRTNDGQPLSEEGQAKFDAARNKAAMAAVTHMAGQLTTGADATAQVEELAATLHKLNAHLYGEIGSKEKLWAAIKALQTAVSKQESREMNSPSIP